MHHQGQQVGTGLALQTVLPQTGEGREAVFEFLAPRLPAVDDTEARFADCDIRPACQQATLLPRKVEQHGEYLGGHLDRQTFDPVKGFADWQGIEDARADCTDLLLHLTYAGARHYRRDGLALCAVDGRIGGLEHAGVHPMVTEHGVVTQDMTAEFIVGRHPLVVGVDFHDVLVTGDGPERSVVARGAVMHRCFLAQAREIGADHIVLIETWIAHVDACERNGVRVHGAVCGHGSTSSR